MFSLFNKKKDNNEVPEWASFFDSKEYSLFINELDNYFKSLKIEYELGDGQIEVQSDEFGFNTMGLTNVSQLCKQEGKKHYKEIIEAHFVSMIRANEFKLEFDKTVHDFDKVKKYIGLRLYDNDYVAHIGKENTIGKAFAGDIYSMIVFDLPDSVSNVKPEEAIVWNRTTDELFEIGNSNIKSNYPLTITKEALDEFSIWLVEGEHFFVPNVVFDLENRKELIGSKGSLVGLPHRHAAIFYPIENLEVVKAVNGLIPVIYGMYDEGPGSLSSSLFWYRDKTFTPLPYKIEDGKLQFFPPADFVELLNELK